MDYNIYLNKKIFVILDTKKGERHYTGKLIEISFLGKNKDGGDRVMFTLIDKFGVYVSFTNDELKIIEEDHQ